MNTKNLATMVAVVPKDKVSKWLANYELLSEYVVPRSAHEYNVDTDLGSFRLFRIVLLRIVIDDVKQSA